MRSQARGGTGRWAVGDGPALHYQAGAWTEAPLPSTVRLNGVAMAGPGEGWAVGDAGAILHYVAGRWEAASSPTRANLRAVAMRGSGEGWAVGDRGTMSM